MQSRLDAVNLTGMDQQNRNLRDDVRILRGDVEKMRYDLDQQNQRDQAAEARLQRLEGGAVAATQSVYGTGDTYTAPGAARSEERREGTECVRTCKSRVTPKH